MLEGRFEGQDSERNKEELEAIDGHMSRRRIESCEGLKFKIEFEPYV